MAALAELGNSGVRRQIFGKKKLDFIAWLTFFLVNV